MRGRFRWVVAGLLVGSAAGPVAGQGPPASLVRVDSARRETVEQWTEVTGQLRAARRSLLATEEGGLVREFSLEEGDHVRAGQVIAQLNDVRARLGLATAAARVNVEKATLAEEQAALELASKDLERYQRSAAAGAAIEMELDRARLTVNEVAARIDGARAEVAAAEADLQLAEQRLADMSIRAPFDGVVVRKHTEVGEWVAEGGPIVEILALDTLEAWVHVAEAHINRVSEASEVQVRIDATGETIAAPVTRVVPDADPRSRLFPVRVRVPNEGGRLRPGMSVTGIVPTGVRGESLTVSKDAVVRLAGSPVVYYDAGGTAAPARVRPLFAVGDRVAVHSDELPEGARTIVEGNERIFPGAPIRVDGAPPAPPAAPGGGPGDPAPGGGGAG